MKSTRHAHDPERSFNTISFFRINSSSVSLNALVKAFSGSVLRLSYLASILGMYSLKKSAHPCPPCPSQTAKRDTSGYSGVNLVTIDILSSLYDLMFPRCELAANPLMTPLMERSDIQASQRSGIVPPPPILTLLTAVNFSGALPPSSTLAATFYTGIFEGQDLIKFE